MKKISFLVMVFLISTNTCATSQYGAEIVELNVNRPGNQVYISTTQSPVEEGCQTNKYWNYTFKLTTEADKAIFSMLSRPEIGLHIGDLFWQTQIIQGKNVPSVTTQWALNYR